MSSLRYFTLRGLTFRNVMLAGLLPAIVAGERTAAVLEPLSPAPVEAPRVPITITVTPAAGSIGTATINSHINMYHSSVALDPGSFSVTWNDVDVTSQYTKSFSGGTGNAYDTLAVRTGYTNTLRVSIDDANGFTTIKTVVYTSTLPPDPVVEVTPNGEPRGVAPSATVTERFLIGNARVTARTFYLTQSCTGAVTSCQTPSPSTVSVSAGGSAEATVTSTVSGTSDQTGTLTLTAVDSAEAGNTSSGSIAVRVGQPVVSDLAAPAPLTRIERGLCLNLAAGTDAAVECGDLRLAHALPSVVTYNTARAPTLLYNSQHAHPYVLVPHNLTVPTSLPTNVTATLTVGGTQRATGSWSGSDWGSAGNSRRIVLGFDALDLATGIYSYTFIARRESAGAVIDSVSGELVVVNRKESPYGAGWWVAGVEQLISISNSRLLWIGGDGSTRVYSPTGITNKWAAVQLTRPDTVTSDGTNYFRHLPQKTRVRFNASGQHVATIKRLGDSTAFGYVSTSLASTLTQITVPGGLQFTFTRVNPGTDDRLASITVPGDPSSRTTTLSRSGDRILSITDPTNLAVSFGYSGTSNRIRTRTNRRTYVTSYEFDSAGKVTEVEIDMGSGEPAIVTTYRALESRGLPGGTFGPAVAPAKAYAMIDGPRSDVADSTLFWLDGYGAPRRIRNALGLETILTRADANWPALVTETRSPMGYIQQATYDTRGNVASSTAVNPLGDAVNATTQYAWNSTWDMPTQITPPIGDATTFDYDASGNRLWQQVGSDSARRVRFRYNTGGRLVAVEAPLTARDSIVYGALGNVDSVRSTTGVWVRSYKDAIGRDTLVTSPIEGTSVLRSHSSYDLMGRVIETKTAAPAMGTSGCTDCSGRAVPAETLTVNTTFDNEGNVTAVNRSAEPMPANGVELVTTNYTYDRAHRKISEQHFGGYQRWQFDVAGNTIATISRRGDTLRSRYDALGRVVRGVVPRVAYDSLVCAPEVDSLMPCPPASPVFDARVIPHDTTRFVFDADGRMLAADNGDARIRRTYYRGGLLATDTLSLRRYDRSSYTTHVYGLQYTYDQLGRRTMLAHPGNLATSAQTAYDYADWGPIETITATFAASRSYTYTYAFDAAGRLDSLRMPGNRNSKMSYDEGGQLIGRSLPLIFDDSLAYDLRGKLRYAGESGNSFQSWYSGLGHVVAGRWAKSAGVQIDEYRMDPHGNVEWTWTRDPLTIDSTVATYSSTGRLTRKVGAGLSGARTDAWRTYDLDGNNARSTDDVVSGSSKARSSTRYYYGADQTLRFTHAVGATHRKQEYRYDALGRRVLVRTQSPNCSGTCPAAIERFVWDGNELLYELRAPDGSASALETAAGSGAQYGKVAYAHGLEIDQPLGLFRTSYVSGTNTLFLVPHANWRGHFRTGTDSSGTGCCSAIDWPAPKMRTYMEEGATAGDWMGSLIQDQRDVSGLLYRRNRYYDPNTGRFTQEDPIGLAGGLNLYGYANGDPVNFSDPFGLAADTLTVSPAAAPLVENCKAKSKTCEKELDALDKSSEKWALDVGQPGSCGTDQSGRLIMAGCSIPAAGGGGTIRVIRGDFAAVARMIGVPVNSVVVIGHEVGHALTDRYPGCKVLGEHCAKQYENVVRGDVGLKKRP